MRMIRYTVYIYIYVCVCVCVCVCFNGHFPGDLFIEAKDDGGGDDNWTTGAISRAKLQSNHQHQQTNIQFFLQADAFPVAQPTVSKH